MYKGLDIVTNKVTTEELSSVKHHLISLVSPLETCTVVDFRDKALPIIQDLLDRGVMPVICGGTNYYIESLLWKILIGQVRHQARNSFQCFKGDEVILQVVVWGFFCSPPRRPCSSKS